MNTHLEHIQTGSAAIPILPEGVAFKGNRLVIPEGCTFDEWEGVGTFIKYVEGAVKWWIGDWLVHGERCWGQMYSQALEVTDYEYDTLAQAKWVSEKVQFCTRVQNLSWSHHREVASLAERDQRALLEKAEREHLSVRALHDEVRQCKHERLIEANPTALDSTYATLVVDPPWPMQKILRRVRPKQQQMDYPTMSIDEVEALPVSRWAPPDAHLYLWTTHKFLPDALRIAEAWGFRYQCLLTWRKNVGITPFSWMYSTEHVLFCRKGNLPLLRQGLRLDFSAKVREHSRKPDTFYDLVREASPGPRLDVFSREAREGFDQWGNENSKFDAD